MATNTYVALKATTVGTATPSVTLDLTGITGYTDIVIQAVGRTATASNSDTYLMTFNGDTGNNYSRTRLLGNGSTPSSARRSDAPNIDFEGLSGNNAASGTYSLATINIQNYANTSVFKTSLIRGNDAASYVIETVGLWRSTSAITSVTLATSSGSNISVGSTFTVYGIAAASVGAKATGGTIYSDSSYFYHVFTGTASFVPTQSLTTDVLCVAGGGGGGSRGGGGGGAGGVLLSTAQSMTATTYTVTVGNGGAAGTSSGGQSGSVGGNSTVTGSGFTTLTATGGGAGGGEGTLGGTGGSGGGSGSGYTTAGGSATSGQGYPGGKFSTTYVIGGGGGGGGAGAAGQDFSAISTWGAGGNGTTAYSAWTDVTAMGQNVSGTYYIAGGGGGGAQGVATLNTGGYGGGGAGNYNSSTATGNAGAINSGGGGGGGGAYAGTGYAGAAGGSGFVIIRYAR